MTQIEKRTIELNSPERALKDGRDLVLPGVRSKEAGLIEAVEELAFDEMNLVELPFALLTDAKEANFKPVAEIPLSPNGCESLVANARGSVPTALAERVVLGLMWLTMQENGFKSATVRFPLRVLIEHYMYPDRFGRNRASGVFLRRVEEELNRVADTRIRSDRWYDKQLGRQTRMNAAIIDYVQVVEEGGRNCARTVEVRWGAQIFKSICDRYTKALDVRTILKIDRPLDLRFYRWLDRQLGTKSREVVHSCQNFARYKLLMRGQKVDRGGRTASSYVVGKLKEALERLDHIGFSVRMTVDEAVADYRLVFERIAGPHNEAVALDQAALLVLQFQRLAHGLPESAKKRRIAELDRDEAGRWLNDYGFAQAQWMIRRAVELHRQSGHKERTLFRFKALGFYENKALADFERQASRPASKHPPSPANAEAAYLAYREAELARARTAFSDEEIAAVRTEVEHEIAAQYDDGSLKPSERVLRTLVTSAMEARLLEEIGALSETAFLRKQSTGRNSR